MEAIDACIFGAYFNDRECCNAGPAFCCSALSRMNPSLASSQNRARSASATRSIPRRKSARSSVRIVPRHSRGGPGCRRDASDRGCAPDVRRIPPTVDGQVDLSRPIASDEVFGPVVTVMTFETLNEAVDLANATSYGLSASVWTCDVDTAVGVGRGVGAGTIWGNTFMDGTPEPPFGGYGQSGLGRELGHSAVAGYTEEKTFHVHKDPRTNWWLPRT